MAMLQLLVLLLSLVPSTMAMCSFPDFLTSIPYWEGHIQNEHYRPDQLLTFRNGTMRMNIYWPSYKVRFLKCHSAQRDNSFIVVDNASGDQPTYKCIKFFKRSAYVMQTAESRISKVADPDICRSDALQLSQWPFLYPVLRDVYVDCPRIGGYDMYMYTIGENNKLASKCDPFIPARLESECMPGEGIVFNFQHHDCVVGWSLRVNQETLCLGSWTEKNFTFVVLHNKADYFAKIWMLRLPSTPSEFYRAYLIKDIVADTNTTIAEQKREKYIAINMKRRIMRTLCEDESPKCNSSCKGDSMKNYCFKSCKVCSNTVLPNCTMKSDSLGLWHDSSISGSKFVNISNDTLNIDKMPPLRCVDLSHGRTNRNSGYRSLVSVFENGCRPRFSCGSFERYSSSIQHFRLSQAISPIATSILLTGDVCFPLNFRPDTTPLKNFYRSTNKKTLVKIPPPPAHRELVPCGLQGPLVLNVTYASGVNCTAKIFNCNLTKSIIWQTDSGCTEPGPKKVLYNCLASYSTLTKSFIITERQDDKKDLHCWVYNDDVFKGSPNKLFVMRPADCNIHSMNDIQFSGIKIYVSRVSFQSAQFSATKECAEVLSPVQGKDSKSDMTTTSPTVKAEATQELQGVGKTTGTPEISTALSDLSDTTMTTMTPTTEASKEAISVASDEETTPSFTTASEDESTVADRAETTVHQSLTESVTHEPAIEESTAMEETTAEMKTEALTTNGDSARKRGDEMKMLSTDVTTVMKSFLSAETGRTTSQQNMVENSETTLDGETLKTTERGTTLTSNEATTESIAGAATEELKNTRNLPEETTTEAVDLTTISQALKQETEKPESTDITELYRSSIEVTSERPSTKPPDERSDNSGTESDSAQLSEVISLTDNFQVLNTTVINITSDKISDSINPGTEATKFRMTKEDNFERPRNSIQAGALASAAYQLNCNVLILSLALLSCSLQLCFFKILCLYS